MRAPAFTQMNSGYKCPTNPAHGQLLLLSNSDKLYCPHSDHTRTNPPTQFTFVYADVDNTYIKEIAIRAKRQYIRRKQPNL